MIEPAETRTAAPGNRAAPSSGRDEEVRMNIRENAVAFAISSTDSLARCDVAAADVPFARAPGDPVDAYWHAFDAHNLGQIDTDAYFVALCAMDDWVPTTPRDFIRKFCAMFDDGGVMSDHRLNKLVGQAHRLLDGPAENR